MEEEKKRQQILVKPVFDDRGHKIGWVACPPTGSQEFLFLNQCLFWLSVHFDPEKYEVIVHD